MTTGPAPLVVSVPTGQLAAGIQPLPDGVDVVIWPMDGPAPRDRFDMVVPPYMSMSSVLDRLAGLEVGLVQSQSIGYDGVDRLIPAGMRFANASGVHEASTAELAVGLAIAAQRGIDRFARTQAHGQWEPFVAPSLADRRVMLLGYGGVGKAIATRLSGFEVEIVPVASRGRDEDGVAVHGTDELPELLPTVDIVITSLPGGEATRHIIDDAFLTALPDDALIVNVGRGPLIDTDALVDHVTRERIRAALDVTDPEPLPSDHPLWTLPGVLIVPHVGGATTAMTPRITRLVRTQIERLTAGEPPLNVVFGG
ncbi:2-hydroxyacid dehydrogenase [Microbacterium aquimaris]|uniref:2-hydroxyacid dehydrogenase n=1 Tax=Microbacterium aquimaris TaxID=459816 RepID=A0ABU5N3A0_9MICO|nr:2-hydroxyacid dehydrogenase [Microbacterium aquimaris]MDZ8160561.1 2-hydroxyacid dehydrogenase [Microbacterium aquimaris]